MMGLTRLRTKRRDKRAFTLIEMAIVLGVASLLFAGLWRLMSSGNTQLRDQAAADLQKQLITAVQNYMVSSAGQAKLRPLSASGTLALTLPSSCTSATGDLCDYLPSGFTASTRNAYGQLYSVRVRKDIGDAGEDAKAYSFMIISTGGSTIPDTSGGRISSMIGNDGGFVYSVQACTTTPVVATSKTACGSYGAWSSSVGDYGYTGTYTGHIVSRTYMGLSAAQTGDWLARKNITNGPTIYGLPDYNVMQTNLFLLPSATPTSVPSSTEHNMYLGGNVIFGGADTTTIAGTIENVQAAILGSTSTSGFVANQDVLASSVWCTLYSGSTDYTSEYTHGGSGKPTYNSNCSSLALRVYGDAAFNGLATANYLKAGYFVYTSDERLKHDIVELTGAVDRLNKIRGVSFVFNAEKENEHRLGVIAQEVEKVYPELVHKGPKGYEEVEYLGLIGPLVRAVKELSQQNDDLRARIDAQEAEIRHLGERVGKRK
jgi:prepilin-type N-terminal cleavage/methylation domain-containing protein